MHCSAIASRTGGTGRDGQGCFVPFLVSGIEQIPQPFTLMGQRQRQWGLATRQRLKAQLGNVCAACGSPDDLTLDCKEPCGDAHHKCESSIRTTFYRQQFHRGNLQCLCSFCNPLKGNRTFSEWRNAVLSALRTVRNQRPFFSSPEERALMVQAMREAIRQELEYSQDDEEAPF